MKFSLRRLGASLLLLTCLSNLGCAALIDAAFRETDDHGSNPRYEQQSFGAHFIDAWLEDDEPSCRCQSTVVINCHH